MGGLSDLGLQVQRAVEELLSEAKLTPGQILVVGCSTSEVIGAKIGTGGSDEAAQIIFNTLHNVCSKYNVFLAVQCCEHLNRALVVERQVMEQYRLEQVTVIPVPKAGGALAARAMQDFTDAVVVEEIAAHAGLDIGCTLIGMHLKRVAVPIRLAQKTVGQAIVTAARTRPKLIGGIRAIYELP
ncbi:TIGR01440 family protein [Dendrosporobacter sp. 1207_IL3150]|uniref:TIGR01440 family protein n=1 Tax=Dendrosporobacter sp. 1207_IL3150 TaxID=3084054 RepID=UPI002FDAFEE0